MPPKKSIAAAATASQACFIRVPRVSGSCNYRDFLKSPLKEKHNRKLFLWSEKDIVDQCFKLQAAQQFKLEKDKLKRAMAEPDRKESRSTWEDMKTRLQDHAPSTSVAQNTEDLQGVSLPKIEIDHKTQMKDLWSVQCYQKFAGNVERKNPNMVLTKKTVGSAFKLMVSRIKENNGASMGRKSAVARILGKESTRYWKDR